MNTTPVVHANRRVLAVAPDVDARTALRVMHENGVRHLPVVHGTRCDGLVTEADLLRALTGPNLDRPPTVADLCHRPAPVVQDGATLPEVAAEILRGGLDAVLVITDGELTGILTGMDILAVVADRG